MPSSPFALKTFKECLMTNRPVPQASINRESLPESQNPLGLDGIEFIEYATSRPQALGQALELMGFRPIARHRSREVILYRQGTMNLIINAQEDDARVSATVGGQPIIAAVAFRVRDAKKAHARCLDLGAWDGPAHAQAMELNIPSIHGPGGTRFFFVDRYKEFSVFDIDFVLIPTVDPKPPALADMSYFGVVQYIGFDRSADWIAFYEQLLGFQAIPDEQRYGILPRGKLMRSPCQQFLWQLVEPDPRVEQRDTRETLQRIGLGVPDVPKAVAMLKARGIEFVEADQLHPDDRGALTQGILGSLSFELVHQA
jgi:4-hydroxyphenylpyruvate dioxygenase